MNSCYYDSIYEADDIGGDNGGDIPTDVTFTTDIEPIFGFCSSCHGESLSPDLREGFAYDALVPSYVTPNNADDSDLYKKLAIENHREVDAVSLALIKEWINRGAENN